MQNSNKSWNCTWRLLVPNYALCPVLEMENFMKWYAGHKYLSIQRTIEMLLGERNFIDEMVSILHYLVCLRFIHQWIQMPALSLAFSHSDLFLGIIEGKPSDKTRHLWMIYNALSFKVSLYKFFDHKHKWERIEDLVKCKLLFT